MPEKEKKSYDAPDIEKIPLADENLDKVTGGTQPDGTADDDDLTPDPDGENTDLENSGISNGDAGKGRGRGRCDGPTYHKSARTFSGGRPGC